jgi:hypothetical protein
MTQCHVCNSDMQCLQQCLMASQATCMVKGCLPSNVMVYPRAEAFAVAGGVQ